MPSPPDADAPPARLPDFALRDQFGRPHGSAALGGTPVVVVVASRDGAKGLAAWMRALTVAAAGSRVRVVPVCDITGVPRLLRAVVRGVMPRDARHWLALDWEGQLGARVRGARGELVAAAYGEDAGLRAWEALAPGAVDAAIAARLVERARGASPEGRAPRAVVRLPAYCRRAAERSRMGRNSDVLR